MKPEDAKQLTQAIDLLEEAMGIVRQLAGQIQPTARTIIEIEKYESRSGNTTWRATCEDGTKLYFRQANRQMYEDQGIWDKLNELDMNSVYAIHIDVETLPDGNFEKITKITKWRDIIDRL